MKHLDARVVAVVLVALGGCQTAPLVSDRAAKAPPPSTVDTKLGCDVALVVLKYRAASASPKQEVLSQALVGKSLWVVADDRPQPSAALLDEYDAAPDSSALLVCKGLSQQARTLGYRSGNAAERWASLDYRGHLLRMYQASVVRIAFPVLSSDRTEALVSYSVRSGRRGGGPGVVYVKRGSDGGWQVKDDIALVLAYHSRSGVAGSSGS